MNLELALSEIGCKQLFKLFEAVKSNVRQPPVVVDADDL